MVKVLIGLNKSLEKIQNDVLLRFLRNNFGAMTTNEVVQAFESAIAGDFQADLNHYGTLASSYVANVLNGYTDYVRRSGLIQKKKEIEVTKEPTKEKKIEAREYIVKQIIDQFNSLQDELFENDEAKIHDIDSPRRFLGVLSDFGYELVSNDQKRKMYAQRRSIELERIGYWMQKGKKHELKAFADKRFMSTSKQSQERNEVHNYVVRKCRIEMLNELYKGQIKSNEDFESDILRRFEVWKRKV